MVKPDYLNMRTSKDQINELQTERNALIEEAKEWDEAFDDGMLSSEEIQAGIEELRPIRLRIHKLDILIKSALDSGDVEGI